MKKQRKSFLIMSFILILAILVLSACVPKSISKAKSKMEKMGYVVSKEETYASPDVNGVIGILQVSKKDNNAEGFLASLYKNEKDAKEVIEDSRWLGGDIYNTRIKNWVLLGSSQAIRDFKSIL